MKSKIISLLFFIFLTINSFSQNQVWLIDGSVYKTDGKGIVDSNKVLIYNKKMKSKLIDTTEIFAIIAGKDTMFLYHSDKYPLKKAKYFMQGQIDGKKYKNTDLYVSSFAVGIISPILLASMSYSTFLSPILPAAFTAVFSKVNPKKNPNNLNPKYINNKEYIRGYKLSATKQKIKNMSIYSIAGLATGIAVLVLINK